MGDYAIDHMEKQVVNKTRVTGTTRLQIVASDISIFHVNTEITAPKISFPATKWPVNELLQLLWQVIWPSCYELLP